MTAPLTIHRATRQGVKPLIGMYGKSGSGKTYSALLLARGLAGASGRVVLVDSESGRGSIFADLVPGGYSVIELEPPFSPQRYQEAIEQAEANAEVVVVDSMSHEWSGEGSVLDMQEAELDRMAGDDWKKREACKMAAWIKPKLAHKKFIQRLLRLKCGLICCLRGEDKTHVIKEDGKNKVVTDDFSSPLFDQRFIYELLINFEIYSIDGKGGFVIPRKITHPQIAPLLPRSDEQIGIKHGEAIAAWCAAPGTKPSTVPKDRRAEYLVTLRTLTQSVHHWTRKPADWPTAKKALQQWMVDELILMDTQTIDELDEQTLEQVIAKVKVKLNSGVMA